MQYRVHGVLAGDGGAGGGVLYAVDELLAVLEGSGLAELHHLPPFATLYCTSAWLPCLPSCPRHQPYRCCQVPL